MSTSPCLCITLFGSFKAKIDSNEPIEIKFEEGSKPQALLAYLTFESNEFKSIERDQVASLLYPNNRDNDEDKSYRAKFKSALRTLKKDIRDSEYNFILEEKGEKLKLNRRNCKDDVTEFLNHIHSCNLSLDRLTEYSEEVVEPLTLAIALYNGDFLANLDSISSDSTEKIIEWNEWLEESRNLLRERAIDTLRFLTQYHIYWREPHKADIYATKWELLDEAAGAWNQELCRQRMHIWAMRGQREKAIAYYRQYLSKWVEYGGLEVTAA